MQYSNYKDAVGHIATRTPFKSNSLSGHNDGSGRFIVLSYHTPIAVINLPYFKVELDVHKYSVTTSRHQNLIRQAVAEIVALNPAVEILEHDRLGWNRGLNTQAVNA